MQIRSEFFKPGVSFFNAGGATQELSHYKYFLNRIPAGKSPKVLFVGIDQFFFNDNWIKFVNIINKIDIEKVFDRSNKISLDVFIGSWRNVYLDYIENKFKLSNVFFNGGAVVKIGLNAKANGNGFRNDGSYFSGKYINDAEYRKKHDYKFEYSLRSVAEGRGWFVYGDKISKNSLGEMEILLDICAKRGIYVIGFLPPYAHAVYAKIEEMGNAFSYKNEILPNIVPMFKKRNFRLYDFSDLLIAGASDDETLDGWHASEKAYLRLFIKIAWDNDVLKRIVDIEYLEKMLKKSINPYEVFGEGVR